MVAARRGIAIRPGVGVRHPNRESQLMDQKQLQIKLSERERQRLRDRIWHDYLGADSNHQKRIKKFTRIWRMWRGLNETKGDPQMGPDFQVPMIKWFTFGHWSRTVQALLGDDAEI